MVHQVSIEFFLHTRHVPVDFPARADSGRRRHYLALRLLTRKFDYFLLIGADQGFVGEAGFAL